eukprot:gnl/TRDRNA2_/TRDRNA2_37083_c0_seq1.p1 gnl/TRDRNA2_/TRDRNA2_37083_c0~~gnl/TRDRNA2_/TRDRNA2_37083_c0_seq1.p1  ORF type:complete len:288 (+),score=51.56 gnl/TRDRNA2_/TRDRNA2_37083_c0_seq1:1-864(+)
MDIANEAFAAPERRAGHIAVVVDRRLFIGGGACGTQYYGKGKWYILDTDAPPAMQMTSPPLCAESVREVMSEYLNQKQFSDVTFVVEGRRIYAHRILLTLFSDYFRRAFACGMRETYEPEIVIEASSYDTFYALLEFLYTGKLRLHQAQLSDVCFLMGLLRASDQFCVDAVKHMCEEHLIGLVDLENVDSFMNEAERFQANQLKLHCEWFKRQHHFHSLHEHRSSHRALSSVGSADYCPMETDVDPEAQQARNPSSFASALQQGSAPAGSSEGDGLPQEKMDLDDAR